MQPRTATLPQHARDRQRCSTFRKMESVVKSGGGWQEGGLHMQRPNLTLARDTDDVANSRSASVHTAEEVCNLDVVPGCSQMGSD